VIFGASSFAGSLQELKENVGSVELYVPKLGIYNGLVLEKEKLERILDEMSTHNFAGTVHAPYSAADPKYPEALQIDTANMGKREFSLLEESMAIANRIGSHVVVLHPEGSAPIGRSPMLQWSATSSPLRLWLRITELCWGLKTKKEQTPLTFVAKQKNFLILLKL
jgi:sugar phosphate isomerase/epimerase